MREIRNKPGRLVLVAGIILILMTLAGCMPPADSASWSGPDGIELRWTPAKPRFGDMVEMTAWFPRGAGLGDSNGSQATTDPKGGLFDPRGEPVASRSSHYRGGAVQVSWAFRIVQVGGWSWGKPGAPLWTVSSEAGQATDLKVFDAQGLWEGKSIPASGTGAGGRP